MTFLHDSFPNVRDDAVEPRKVSHREEINDESEANTIVLNNVNWCCRLHHS
jgi:hypothetical protein